MIEGTEHNDKWKVKMEKREPLMNLSLGINIGESETNNNNNNNNSSFIISSKTCDGSKKCQNVRNVKVEVVDDHEFDHVVESVSYSKSPVVVSFTEDQFKQFKLQLIIFKYIVWGLPVPLQLLTSLETSLFPLWVGICNQGTHCRDMMDPEPGRCRRTDGKKWRCYQSVVLNEKYCEKHMHRGRKRSRKLVEDVTTNTPNVNGNLSKSAETPGFLVPAMPIRDSKPLKQPNGDVVKASGLIDTVAKKDEKVEISNKGEHDIVVNLPLSLNFSTENGSQDGHRYSEVERQVKVHRQVIQSCNRTDERKWLCHSAALPSQKFCTQYIDTDLKKSATISPSTCQLSNPEQAEEVMGLDIASSSSNSSDPSTETTISDDSAYISNLVAVSSRIQ